MILWKQLSKHWSQGGSVAPQRFPAGQVTLLHNLLCLKTYLYQ